MPATVLKLSVVALVLVAALVAAVSAQADPATTCVKATKVKPPKPAKPHYTGGYEDKACAAASGKHEGKYEKLAAFSESEEQELKALLKYVNVEASGVAGEPTVQFSGANVQIINGEGNTASANGEGNLVVGYDEKPGTQTGSHNLILGEEQTFTSFGGILGGKENTISAPFASASGGSKNTASGENASVSGGNGNTASANGASVTGGSTNIASGPVASVSGGNENSSDRLVVVGRRRREEPGRGAGILRIPDVGVRRLQKTRPPATTHRSPGAKKKKRKTNSKLSSRQPTAAPAARPLAVGPPRCLESRRLRLPGTGGPRGISCSSCPPLVAAARSRLPRMSSGS